MVMLHPVFAGGEQVLALFGLKRQQCGIRRIGQLRQLLAEIRR
jgi:hypothetical protein